MAAHAWYPLLLEPHLRPTPWGGQRLAEHLHKPLAAQPVGESWEAFDDSTVANGPHAGTRLQDLLRHSVRDVLGEGATGTAPFPLLFKFLDAQQDLSVQVHPDDAHAQALEGYPYGKTEAWYILHAEPGARIVHGFRAGVDEAAVRAALAEHVFADLLAFVPVQRGDVVFVPAGTVHAVLKGIVLAEIQQQSDITYRFYDWNRMDDSGRPRALHVEKALRVTNFSALETHTVRPLSICSEAYDRDWLVACRYFAWERLNVRACTPELPLDKFQLLSVIAGAAEVAYGDRYSHSLSARHGQTVLLPARLQSYRLRPAQQPCVLLKAYVPALRADVVAPLRAAGHPDASIQQLGGADVAHNDVLPIIHSTSA
ncbi:MAG: mannose-6-phosphate isomerase [Chloroflexi bacterium]|nr:MAG: mannose-6-phosphate isomerase [Chloroflexota bacterium]